MEQDFERVGQKLEETESQEDCSSELPKLKSLQSTRAHVFAAPKLFAVEAVSTESEVRDNRGSDVDTNAPNLPSAAFTSRSYHLEHQRNSDLPAETLASLQAPMSQDSIPVTTLSTGTFIMAPRRKSSASVAVTSKSSTPTTHISSSPQARVDPTLQSLTQFMNANLIQQKRLKANNSQITLVARSFMDLKVKYESSFTIPPSTTSAVRVQMYTHLRKFAARYDTLLELRRQMLERQQAWLEAALDAAALKDSMQLGLAIDMQIEAAKELAVLQAEANLQR